VTYRNPWGKVEKINMESLVLRIFIDTCKQKYIIEAILLEVSNCSPFQIKYTFSFCVFSLSAELIRMCRSCSYAGGVKDVLNCTKILFKLFSLISTKERQRRKTVRRKK